MSQQFELSTLVRRAALQAGRELIRALDATLADVESGQSPAAEDVRSEMHRFRQSLDRLSDSDLAIYRAALSGLEDTLMAGDFHYRSVLDRLLQNVGALLTDLGCFELFGGEMPAITYDLTWAGSARARMDVTESLPLEQTRRRLRQTRLAQLFDGTMPALARQRLYRPRLFRAPAVDERSYGFIGYDRYRAEDAVMIMTQVLPDTPAAGQAELPVLVQRTRLRDRLFSALPARQEARPKLRPDDFAHILQGVLLDTRAYCYRRARDQQQREQLNTLLFRVLVEGQEDVEHLRSPRSASVQEPPSLERGT